MKRLVLIFIAVLTAACGSSPDGGGRSGTGGTAGAGGSGGAFEIPTGVDGTCRSYCANEPAGMSCGMNGTAPELSGGDTVQQCYENCLDHYERQASLTSRCEDEWIAILDCYIDLDCNDLFGDCDAAVQAYTECNPGEPRRRNLVYCENPDVAAPSCSLPGYSMPDDSALHAKLSTCAVGGCHGTGGTAVTTWTLDMSGSVQNALAPLATTLGASGDYLVDEFDPDCSYMLTKLTDQPGGGSRQPLTPPYWSSDEIDCFRSYLHDL